MSNGELPNPTPPQKPQRAAAPVTRPSAPTLASPGKLHVKRPMTANADRSDALSELAAIAGSTIAPSSMAPSSASTMSTIRASMPTVSAAASARQAKSNRATLVPPCLTLGLTLPLLGIAWFTLDRHRVLRDNPLGVVLPILLFVGGAIFLGLLALMLLGGQVRRQRLPTSESHADTDS